MRSIFHKYYLDDGIVIDVYGYDHETQKYNYMVHKKNTYYYKDRQAKEQYKYPDKRNEWLFPYGTYINVILPNGNKKRLFLD